VTFFLVIMIHLHLNELTNKTNIVEIVSLKKNVFLVKLISVGCKKKQEISYLRTECEKIFFAHERII
jgi:hypothetical protein